jgi:Zn finger protein HypA/HybF involved in hydrogenase expression
MSAHPQVVALGAAVREIETDYSCTWCTITNNHPKCLVNQELYPPCPNCGSDPDDITLHARDCPTPEWVIE